MSTSRFRVRSHTVPTAHIREYPRALADGEDDVLQLAVKQYTPFDNLDPQPGDITIIGGHANGFPKELYEPFWDELYVRLKAKNIKIRNIFISDFACQGESGVLNEDKLGNDPSWYDHPRDLFLMVNHFRRDIQRPIFGVGHSMGGNHLVNLSLLHPRLFTSLILIDAVIQRVPSKAGNVGPAKASTTRRDRWPSRKAAEAAFKKSKFYQTWDPRVLDKWLEFGLRDLPTRLYPEVTAASSTPPIITADISTATVAPAKDTEVEVTLATTKHQEVFTFLRPNYPTPDNPDPFWNPNPITHPDVDLDLGPNVPFYRPEPSMTFLRLPHLRPSVLWVFGETSNLSLPFMQAEKLDTTGTGVGGSGGVKAGRVSSITIPKVGHLIPMEDVSGCADASVDWITPELDRWKRIEAAERQAWAAVPKAQKTVLSDRVVEIMKGDFSEFEKVAPGSKL